MSNRQTRQSGFTLIELMIVVAIIGILASIGVSSYQTYAVRAQVTEGLNFAGNAKVPIVDAYTMTGEAPANRTAAGFTGDASDTYGKYVKSVDIVNGRLEVTFGNDANAIIGNATLSVTPYETPDGSVVWRCGASEVPTSPNGTALSTIGSSGAGNAAIYAVSTVDSRYLPSTCR
jgi:type IV pilus assembly protein PilA